MATSSNRRQIEAIARQKQNKKYQKLKKKTNRENEMKKRLRIMVFPIAMKL